MNTSTETVTDISPWQKWKSRVWKILSTALYLIGGILLLFLYLILTLVEQQNAAPKKNETPMEVVQSVQKEVGAFYDSEQVTEKEGEVLYAKLRQTEALVLKEAKANDEKTLLLTRIGLMKQDVLYKMP